MGRTAGAGLVQWIFMPPYVAITGAADRPWTFRLLDRLTAPDLPAGQRADLVAGLQAVSDRRAVPVQERRKATH